MFSSESKLFHEGRGRAAPELALGHRLQDDGVVRDGAKNVGLDHGAVADDRAVADGSDGARARSPYSGSGLSFKYCAFASSAVSFLAVRRRPSRRCAS